MRQNVTLSVKGLNFLYYKTGFIQGLIHQKVASVLLSVYAEYTAYKYSTNGIITGRLTKEGRICYTRNYLKSGVNPTFRSRSGKLSLVSLNPE